MKTKIYSLLVLLFLSNHLFAQIESDENAGALEVSTGTINTVWYNKCDGVLYISYRTSGYAGDRALYKSYVYVKIGTQWETMLSIRGEEVSNVMDNKGTCMNSALPNWPYWNGTMLINYQDVVTNANHPSATARWGAGTTGNQTGTIEAGHNKKRIGYYSGAHAKSYWASYEDEQICKTYSTTDLSVVNNVISFQPYTSFSKPAVGHSSGIQTHLQGIDICPTTDTEWGLLIGIANIPREAISGNSIAVRIYKHYNDIYNFLPTPAGAADYEFQEYSVSTNLPDGPMGLSATTNQCNQVTLNWQNPAQTWTSSLNCTEPQNYDIGIYRNGNLIKIVDGTISTYTDIDDNGTNNLVPRQTYDYTVKTILWNKGDKSYRISASSNLAVGSMKLPPAQPSPFTASDDNCSSTIELNWSQPNGTAVNSYTLTTSTYTTGITSSARSYDWNTSVTRGTNYTINLTAYNDCGYPSDVAQVSGISPADPAIATGVSVTLNASSDTATISWTDNANNETKYQVVRQDNLGNVVTFDVNPNVTQFKDDGLVACRDLSYSVKAFNDCVQSGLISASVSTGVIPPPSLSTSFTSSKKLICSKGYFSNRVELNWQNNNGQNIDLFKIYRKIDGTSFDSTLIGTAGSGSGFYVDYTADGKVYYKYTIVGVKFCNGTDMLTNTSEDIGFRITSGVVSGHIEYNGGIALTGSKVLVQQAGAATGNSLEFTSNDSLIMQNASTLGLSDKLRMEFWLKPTSNSDQNIVDKPGVFSFKNVGANYVATITAGSTYSISVAETNLTLNNWNHISMQYDGTAGNFKLFQNGLQVGGTVATSSVSVASVSNKILFGGDVNTSFLLDEFRLIANATTLDTNIYIDHGRFLNSSDPGFKISLRMDENYGNYAYDGSSQNSVYNANHFVKTSGVSWSLDKPSSGQLSYYGITDALGNYIVMGISCAGTGENFTIIPSYPSHSFTPSSRSIFIGDGSTVFNNQDFIDNSAFPVSGTLFYKNTSCPVPDATLKIDGATVIKNGLPVVTDVAGTFTISVPIGQHYVTIEKYAHAMAQGGRFPLTGTYDFQAPVNGIPFIDSTLRSIVGRVVGGLDQADKAPNMGRSKNNIGKARIRIVSPIAGLPCATYTVNTVDSSGEYKFDVPPLEYRVDSVYVISNKNVLSAHINPSPFTNSHQLIDLRNTVSTTTEIDSVFSPTGVWTGVVDSTKFHIRRDFIHRVAPSVNVTQMDGSTFIGEDSLSFGATKYSIKPSLLPPWGPFSWPVFKQGNQYVAKISGSEIYTNFDNPAMKDTVLLDGNVRFTNDLINGADPSPVVPMTDGVATYTFTCGEPNNATHGLNPALDYSKDIQVVLEPQGAASVTWKPNETVSPGYPNYHAIVAGQKITGTGVSTQGPERVDFILRDPPGSGSSSTWGTGVTVSKSTSYSRGVNEESETTVSLLLGKKALTGAIAYYEEIEIDNTVGLGFSNTYEKNKEDSYTETMTNFSTVSTRDDADNVGAPADIFIGRAKNWLVGPTSNIELKAVGTCSVGGTCFGPTVNGYKLAKTVGYVIAPDGVRTRFSYTQKEIEEVVIPQLQSIRATFLNGSNPKYVSFKASNDPLFGINNDDPLLGAARTTTTTVVYEQADTSGASYRFYGIKTGTDSVRAINTQIALWKQSLARNEREKYNCVMGLGGTVVDNFTLGSAIVNNTYSLDQETSSTETYELALGGNAKAELGAAIGGIGFKTDISLTVMETRGNSSSNGVTQSTSFEYTLTDGDPGDIMSIDVFKSPEGTGNIFVTRGGQTMCPYEDAVKLHYYNPAQPTAYIGSHDYSSAGYQTIQNATVQREEPNIVITPNFQYSIPSDQPAIFQLVLTNQSALTVNNDIDLRVYVASQSNPYGAIVKIDGLTPNTSYTIPTGASVIKTLTVERGPIEINYDSLMIIFASECSDDLADTAYISAHFIPTCTPLDMTAPSNNWVFNNSINNSANLIVSNYNYNYSAAVDTSTNPDTQLGLTKIGLEVKPGSTSTWTEFKSFYKYPTVGQDTIPDDQIYAQHMWNISNIPDGAYEIKAKSHCLNKDGSYSTIESPILAGVMDRINPHPFGTPSPADGILDPNDDISIQFNEPVDIGALSVLNFDVRGVLNGGAIRHYESLQFDGVNDYADVSGGISVQKRNFTFEFWAKLNATGIDQTVISQGTDAAQSLAIGFDATDRLTFSLGNQTVTSNNPIATVTQWHHYALVYDYSLQTVNMYVDGVTPPSNTGNTTIFFDYNGSGKMAFGKKLPANTNFFNGNIHDVRLWNTARSIGQIVQNFIVDMNRSHSGLLYNWKMDEADGATAKDYIRSRNATLYGPSWSISPGGNAAQFDGVDDRLELTSSTVPIIKEMDFTLEFWFNSSQIGTATIFSNGKGDGLGADSLISWNIQKDAAGKIHVYHRGLDFVATNNNYFDGNWHHFALVMQRTANLSCYIDGNLQNSVQALSFEQMGGSYFYVGARGYKIGVTTAYDNYYNGKMDEFRFWNTARRVEQIVRDKQNRLLGDEYGLQGYVPFESYAVVLGVPILGPSFKDYSSGDPSIHTDSTFVKNGTALIVQTPTIKLPRPVQAINFAYSVNNDKIIITPTSAPALIENVTLDVTVKDVYDLRGNKMQSPKTWIAFMNKNQVLWQDAELNFVKTQDSTIVFTTQIVNSGGAQKAYTVSGLPSWMTTTTTSGTIAPNSTQNITFTIPSGTSIGDFNADIALTTDFGYDEIMHVNLKVNGIAPTWNFDPSQFQYSMNIFGEMKINGVIATNTANQIGAFINDTLCGKANLVYVSAYDRYEAFLTVYGNVLTGDSIKFNLYDATTGLTHVNVTPSIMFVESGVTGTVNSPVTFVANTEVKLNMPVNAGWTWVSFPLQSNQLQHSNYLMANTTNTQNDVIRSISAYDQYDTTMGWIGNISSSPARFQNSQSYKIQKTVADTLPLVGSRINPDSSIADINVVPGWNWIGYVATKTSDLNTALGNYNAVTGDIIKSQFEFAYYDNLTGWAGSLTTMYPGYGYMLKSSGTSTFNYPLSIFFGKYANTDNLAFQKPESLNEKNVFYPFDPTVYKNTMSVIVKSDLCPTLSSDSTVALGAFDSNNSLRGYAQAKFIPATQSWIYYLTAYSNLNSETLNLRYFNVVDGTTAVSTGNVAFSPDAVLGSTSLPVLADVPDSLECNKTTLGVNEGTFAYTGVNVYPNPFSNIMEVTFDQKVNVKIELVDVLGRTLGSTEVKNTSSVSFNNMISNVSNGVYNLVITGDKNANIRVIKAAK